MTDLPAPTPLDVRVRIRRFLAVPIPQLLLSSSLLKNSKLSSERFCGERLVSNSLTRVRK
jgi:hypothetical protein